MFLKSENWSVEELKLGQQGKRNNMFCCCRTAAKKRSDWNGLTASMVADLSINSFQNVLRSKTEDACRLGILQEL